MAWKCLLLLVLPQRNGVAQRLLERKLSNIQCCKANIQNSRDRCHPGQNPFLGLAKPPRPRKKWTSIAIQAPLGIKASGCWVLGRFDLHMIVQINTAQFSNNLGSPHRHFFIQGA